MQNSFLKAIKATITYIIVAFIFVAFIILTCYFCGKEEINMAISLVNTISAGATSNVEEKQVTMEVLEDGKNIIKGYPNYGQKYAQIKIESANIDLPVYFGDSLAILKNGVGQSTGSYLPGEGASIVMCAHNAANKFRNLRLVKKDDIIQIETSYGIFKYKVYDMQVIKETEFNKLPIQKEKEILMIYTCYPFDALGYTTNRYVIYSNLLEWEAL